MREPARHHILTPLQEQALRVIFEDDVARDSFALVGGTALAEFFYGHRLSRDLDIFGLDPEEVPALTDRIARVLVARITGASVESVRSGGSHRRLSITVPGADALQVDVAVLDPPLLAPFHRVDTVNVLSLDDIAVGKVMAIHDRVEIRDAIDLYAMAGDGMDLEVVRERALRKDAGLAGRPLGLVEMLDRLAAIIEKVEWPQTFLSVTPPQLSTFVESLRDRYLDAIRRDAENRAERAGGDN